MRHQMVLPSLRMHELITEIFKVSKYILSNSRNLTLLTWSVCLVHQKNQKPEVHTNILCFETDKLLSLLNSGKAWHFNNWKR